MDRVNYLRYFIVLAFFVSTHLTLFETFNVTVTRGCDRRFFTRNGSSEKENLSLSVSVLQQAEEFLREGYHILDPTGKRSPMSNLGFPLQIQRTSQLFCGISNQTVPWKWNTGNNTYMMFSPCLGAETDVLSTSSCLDSGVKGKVDHKFCHWSHYHFANPAIGFLFSTISPVFSHQKMKWFYYELNSKPNKMNQIEISKEVVSKLTTKEKRPAYPTTMPFDKEKFQHSNLKSQKCFGRNMTSTSQLNNTENRNQNLQMAGEKNQTCFSSSLPSLHDSITRNIYLSTSEKSYLKKRQHFHNVHERKNQEQNKCGNSTGFDTPKRIFMNENREKMNNQSGVQDCCIDSQMVNISFPFNMDSSPIHKNISLFEKINDHLDSTLSVNGNNTCFQEICTSSDMVHNGYNFYSHTPKDSIHSSKNDDHMLVDIEVTLKIDENNTCSLHICKSSDTVNTNYEVDEKQKSQVESIEIQCEESLKFQKHCPVNTSFLDSEFDHIKMAKERTEQKSLLFQEDLFCLQSDLTATNGTVVTDEIPTKHPHLHQVSSPCHHLHHECPKFRQAICMNTSIFYSPTIFGSQRLGLSIDREKICYQKFPIPLKCPGPHLLSKRSSFYSVKDTNQNLKFGMLQPSVQKKNTCLNTSNIYKQGRDDLSSPQKENVRGIDQEMVINDNKDNADCLCGQHEVSFYPKVSPDPTASPDIPVDKTESTLSGEMTWPLRFLVSCCSLLVLIWSLYGAACIYKFYLEEKRNMNPLSPHGYHGNIPSPSTPDSLQTLVDVMKGERAVATGFFPTGNQSSPSKKLKSPVPRSMREQFQQLLHSDSCLGDRVELYATDHIRSMVRYDPGLGMKLWPHFKHNTRRYVCRTVTDRRILQYAEKKLHSRMLADSAFQEDIYVYVEKHVWPEVRRQMRTAAGADRALEMGFKYRDVIRAETLAYLTSRFSAMLRHDGVLEREIMSQVDRTRHNQNF